MAEKSELIQRLHDATGPDRELDIAIAFAFGRIRERDGNHLYATGNDSDMVVEPNAWDDHIVAQPLPYYTASVDAAFSLFGGNLPRGVQIYRNSAPDMGGRDWGVSPPRTIARSWPLAICMAALKHR